MTFDLRPYFGCDKINFVYGPAYTSYNNIKILHEWNEIEDVKTVKKSRYYNFLEYDIVEIKNKIAYIQRERFRTTDNWTHQCLNEFTESLAKKLNPSICNVFVMQTAEGPDWWYEGKHADGSSSKDLFQIIKEKIPKFFWMLKKRNLHLLIDQSLEGYPMEKLYSSIHNVFEKEKSDISKLHFVTSNLYEQKIYDRWKQKNKKTVGFNIIAKPWFTKFKWDITQNKINVNIQKKFKFDNPNIKLFNCLNRRGRPDRIRFLNYLNYFNLIENNFVSAGDECKRFEKPQRYSEIDMEILKKRNQMQYYNKVPITVDEWNFKINFAGNLNLDLYLNSWFTVTSETFVSEYTDTSMFFSEKTFKPIVTCSPFIMVAAPKSITNLKELGYETFSDIIDESYDNIQDRPTRFKKICEILLELQKLTPRQLYSMFCKVQDILEHNQNLYFNTNGYIR